MGSGIEGGVNSGTPVAYEDTPGVAPVASMARPAAPPPPGLRAPPVPSSRKPYVSTGAVLPVPQKQPPSDKMAALADEFMARTYDRAGTDEEFVYKSLQLVFSYGKVSELNTLLRQRLRANGESLTSRAPTASFASSSPKR